MAETSQPELVPGSELAGYRIEGVLGRGGMGVVYSALDLALERRVALKLLAPELAEDPRFRDRFHRESRLAASLDHPAIVPIYEAGEAEGRLYIAMRLVEGSDLKSLLRQEGKLEPERMLALLSQVAAALDAAHERGLVHRDVKPSNVLIDTRGYCYLADFGLSRRLADHDQGLGGARSLGTSDYAAPEQIRGEEPTPASDIYSLTCLLYECLTGTPPFHRPSELATVFAHLEEEPPQLPKLEGVIATGLAKEPAERYPSCRELIEAVRDALGVRRRHRGRLVLAAAALVAMAGIAATLLLTVSAPGGISRANGLAEESLANRSSQAGLQLAVEAAKAAQTPASTSALRVALASDPVVGKFSGSSASFGPHGRDVLTIGSRAIHIWNVSTGHLVRSFTHVGRLPAGNSDVSRVALDPARRELLVTPANGQAAIWSTQTGKLLRRLPTTEENPVFSPDGKYVLTRGRRPSSNVGWSPIGETAQLWDTTTGRSLKLYGHVTSSAFSPNGSLLAIGTDKGSVEVSALVSGQSVLQLDRLGGSVVSLGFGRDGRELLIAAGNTVTLWNIATGRRLRVFHAPVVAASLSADGSRVLATLDCLGGDATVEVWDAGNRQTMLKVPNAVLVPKFYGPPAEGCVKQQPQGRALLSPDGRSVLVESGGVKPAQVWDIASRQKIATFGGGHRIIEASYSPKGKRILTVADNGSVEIFRAPSNSYSPTYPGYFRGTSPDGKRLLTTDKKSHTTRIWTLSTGREVVLPVAGAHGFSSNSRHVLTRSRGGIYRIWSLEGTLIQTVHRSGTVGPNPDTEYVNGPCGEQWSPKTLLKARRFLRPHGGFAAVDAARGACAFAFSQNQSRAFIVGHNRSQWLADLSTGRLQRLQGKMGDGGARWITFNASETRVATVSSRGIARLWDTTTGHLVAKLNYHGAPENLQHGAPVNYLRFNREGTSLWTENLLGDAGTAAQLWDAQSGRLMAYATDLGGGNPTFSPNGATMVWQDSGAWEILNASTGRRKVLAGSYVTFTPDGNELITETRRTATAWDALTGHPLQVITKAHSARVHLGAGGRDLVLINTNGVQVEPCDLCEVSFKRLLIRAEQQEFNSNR